MVLRTLAVCAPIALGVLGCVGPGEPVDRPKAEPQRSAPGPKVEAPVEVAPSAEEPEESAESFRSEEPVLSFGVRDYASRQERQIRYRVSDGVFLGEVKAPSQWEDLLRSFPAFVQGDRMRRVSLGQQPVPGFPGLGTPETIDLIVEGALAAPRIRLHRDATARIVAVQVFDDESSEPSVVLQVMAWTTFADQQVPTAFASTAGLELELFGLELR